MSMDDVPNDNPKSSSTPEEKKNADIPKPRSLKNTFTIGLVALILGSVATLIIQHFYHPNNRPSPSPTIKSDYHWQELKNQIQTLSQSQQKITSQVLLQQHQIQALKQTTLSQTKNEDIQKAMYYLDLAQINAQWSHNITATMHLLLAADQILANSQHPNLSNIRLAIREDLKTLEQIPPIDTIGLLSKLSTLDQKITQFSIQSNTVTPKSMQSSKTASWRDNLQDNMQQLRGLISIHYQDTTWLEPFNPDYLALLRENIRMNLQQAELAVVEQHQALYQLALSSIEKSLCTGFNPNNPKTQALLNEVHDLQKATVVYPIPKLHLYASLFEYPSQEITPSNTEVLP